MTWPAVFIMPTLLDHASYHKLHAWLKISSLLTYTQKMQSLYQLLQGFYVIGYYFATFLAVLIIVVIVAQCISKYQWFRMSNQYSELYIMKFIFEIADTLMSTKSDRTTESIQIKSKIAKNIHKLLICFNNRIKPLTRTKDSDFNLEYIKRLEALSIALSGLKIKAMVDTTQTRIATTNKLSDLLLLLEDHDWDRVSWMPALSAEHDNRTRIKFELKIILHLLHLLVYPYLGLFINRYFHIFNESITQYINLAVYSWTILIFLIFVLTIDPKNSLFEMLKEMISKIKSK